MASLDDLGLSEYEARVYRTLLRTGPTTAKELSNTSGVPMGRIYDVLNGLDAAGIVRSQDVSRPKKYAPVDPDTALDRLMEEKRRELQSEIRQYEEIVDDLAEKLESSDPVDEQFWTVAIGPENTVELLVDRLAAATDTVVIVAAEPASGFDLGEMGQRVADEIENALDRGVEVTGLLSPEMIEAVPREVNRRYAESIGTRENFDVRLSQEISGTFHLIDRTEVVIEVRNPLDGDEAFALIDLTDPTFAANVYEEFRPRWETATTFEEIDPGRLPDGL